MLDSAPSTPLTKGERTRQLLIDACQQVFAALGYHEAKISDICRQAGVSAGTFYVYFKDKDELAEVVFAQLIKANVNEVLEAPKGDHPFESILAANRRYVDIFARGGPLNRAISQIIDSKPAMREAWMKANHEIAHAIVTSTRRHRPAAPAARIKDAFAALAAQAMLDQVLIQYFAWNDAMLHQSAPTLDELAEQLSIAWYRLLYASDPPPDRMRSARALMRKAVPHKEPTA